jgi:hypothetical protein
MKCLKCSANALPDKALCAKCYVEHEKRESYQKTDEWLSQTLDSTRDQFKIKGAVDSRSRLKYWIERLAALGLIAAVLLYLLLWTSSDELDWKAQTQKLATTELDNLALIPVPLSVTPTIDPDTRSVWVGNSPGSIPLLLEAIDLVNRQERRPDLRWTIKLEAGEHRVAGSVVIPSYSTLIGQGQLQSKIIGMTSGLDFNDDSAALIVLKRGSRIEQASIENEGTGNTAVVIRCSSTKVPNPETPGDTHNTVRGIALNAPNPVERKYGIVNNGCDMRLEQVNINIGNASITSQGMLSMGDTAQMSVIDSSFVAEDQEGGCSAQTTAGCVGVSILRGTVSLRDSKIRAASQGATVLDGTLQLIRSEVTSPNRGVIVIQSGDLVSQASTISSIINASSGQVVCKETTKPDGVLYSDSCS